MNGAPSSTARGRSVRIGRLVVEAGLERRVVGRQREGEDAPPIGARRVPQAPPLRLGEHLRHREPEPRPAHVVQHRFGAKEWDEDATEVVLGDPRAAIQDLDDQLTAFAPRDQVDRGDVAVVPEPAYQAYLGGTLLSDATPHVYALRPRTDFLLEPDELPPEVVARTRVVYLNYPNNPTTAVAPRDYLERVVRFCRAHDALLVYDNAYSELAFDGYVPPSIFEVEGARDVAIEFHSLSKTYNMTGWRCGWAVAKPEIAGALAKVKTFVDTGAYMGIQAAGVAALESGSEWIAGNVAIFLERRDAAVAAFRAAGFSVSPPRATMYLWIPLPEGVPSKAFADRLMEEEGVIVLPGAGFGAGGEGYFRISFIVPPARLAEAAARAGRLLARWPAAT